MNYLGAEPARYQLRNHNFLSNIEFNLECPPLKGAMGDDQLCFRTKFGAHRNLENHPPALKTAVGIASAPPAESVAQLKLC